MHTNTQKTRSEFRTKIGSVCKFYGVDWHSFKLDHTTYEVLENPDDGYRSYMQAVIVQPEHELIFFKKKLRQCCSGKNKQARFHWLSVERFKR